MKSARLFFLLLLAGIAGGGWYYWSQKAQETASAPRAGGRRSGPAGDGPAAVVAATVRSETVPVYREGIGNVQAFALVTVKAQIDGKLLSVDFKEGQTVRKGDVLARIDPATWQAQLDQALAKKAQDQANLANARLDQERYEKLAASNAGSRQQADQQKAIVAQLEAQTRSDDAAIDNARAFVSYTIVTSPIDGRVGIRQVDAGNIVHPSDAAGIVTVAQLKPISSIFTLPQRDLSVIPAALARGPVLVEAMDTDGKTVLATGALQVVDNQVDVATGTIKLKAVFPNDDERLWPGQFLSVRLTVATLAQARTVPATAIRRGPLGTFVYVVGAGEKANVRPVSVVQQDEARAVIGQGLEPGERVVTTGFSRLTEGKLLDVTPAPDGGAPSVPVAEEPRPRRNGEGRRERTPGAEGQPEGRRGQRS